MRFYPSLRYSVSERTGTSILPGGCLHAMLLQPQVYSSCDGYGTSLFPEVAFTCFYPSESVSERAGILILPGGCLHALLPQLQVYCSVRERAGTLILPVMDLGPCSFLRLP